MNKDAEKIAEIMCQSEGKFSMDAKTLSAIEHIERSYTASEKEQLHQLAESRYFETCGSEKMDEAIDDAVENINQ